MLLQVQPVRELGILTKKVMLLGKFSLFIYCCAFIFNKPHCVIYSGLVHKKQVTQHWLP